ncbi:MAG: DUF697 domain-containing protein [Desulfobacteraceae bacterium]|nr:MAG: DUF697 domain-containing protein [Desulfobacteraceae bacterium]
MEMEAEKKIEKTIEQLFAEKDPVANNTIKNYLIGAMGVGLIPFPIVDFVAIAGIQLGMLKKLSDIYEVEFSKDMGKSIIGSLVGSATPFLILQPAASLIKVIPIVGWSIGMATMPIVAGASTYALGKVFKKHFETGGTLFNLDPERMKKYYEEKYTEGKKMAGELKKEAAAKKI